METAGTDESAGSEPSGPPAIGDRTMAGNRGAVVALGVAAAVIVADQVTKAIALDQLTYGEPQPVVWTLDWNLIYNTGSAFGLGSGLGRLIGLLAIGIAGVLIWLSRRTTRPSANALCGVIAGGAIGNIIDRIFRAGDCPQGGCDGFMGGAVIDFIDLNWWPVFNIADICVVCGAIALGFLAFVDDRVFG